MITLRSTVRCFTPAKTLRLKMRVAEQLKLYQSFGIGTTSAASSVKLDASISKLQPIFRTERQPSVQSEEQAGMFYTIPLEEYARLFTHGGLLKELKKQMKSFNESCIMIRSPALEIIDYIKKANYSLPAVRYLLYGRTGSGKTVSVAHILHYASTNGFLILHVPWVPFWTRLAYIEQQPNGYNTSRIDIPSGGLTWLQAFKLQNAELVQKLNLVTSQRYEWSKREVTEQGSPLMQVVEHGINRVKFACDCVGVIMKEIKLHTNNGKCRAMVAVDGVNAMFHHSCHKREKVLLHSKDISLVHHTKKLLKNDWCNSAIVVVADEIASPSSIRESWLPRYLITKEGFELLDPFIPVLVENYNEKEIYSCLEYYIERGWIQNEKGTTEQGKQELAYLSGFNPQRLMQLTGPL